eukprot:3936342-Rhodomonas_salina.1
MIAVLTPASHIHTDGFIETLDRMLTALHPSTRPADPSAAFALFYNTLTPLRTPTDIVDPSDADPCARILHKLLQALKSLRTMVKHGALHPHTPEFSRPWYPDTPYKWENSKFARSWDTAITRIHWAVPDTGSSRDRDWDHAFRRCFVIDNDIEMRARDTVILTIASGTHPRLGANGASPLYHMTQDNMRMITDMVLEAIAVEQHPLIQRPA